MANNRNNQNKQAAQADAGGSKEYTVKTVVNHDGEHYQPDSPITLTAKQAAPLLAVNAISDPDQADNEGQA